MKKQVLVSTDGEVHYILEEPPFNKIEVAGTHEFSRIKKGLKKEALKPLFLIRN